jgi:septal ring factor EnvC (AmiA/AmiB activator)
MIALNEFDKVLHDVEEEIKKEAHELDSKKAELKKIETESATLKTEIDQAKLKIQGDEKKMKENEARKRILDQEVMHLIGKQRENQMKLTRAEETNRQRLQGHGVKLERPRF